MTRTLIVVVALVFAWGTVGRLLAQGVPPSVLVGTVTDGSGAAIAGATVTVEGDSLIGGPMTTTTDPAGRFRVSPLVAGTYSMTAAAPGFAALRRIGIRLPVGTQLVVDAQLGIAGLRDAVTVSAADPPIVDVGSAAVPTHFDEHVLQNLPTDRSVYSLINLAPGVGADVALGGTRLSNAFLVDGVDVTEPVTGGTWVSLNYNWVKEATVSALGADAEYGQFTGATMTAVLRSGTNRFSGLGEFWMTRPGWLSDNRASLPAATALRFTPRQIVSWWDGSVQLGGPMVRDRLWFFSGFETFHHEDRPAGFAGPGSVSESDPRVIAKVEYAPASGLRLEGMVQYDALGIEGNGAGPTRPMDTTVDVRQPALVWNARASWSLSPRTQVDLRAGGFSGPQVGTPHGPGGVDGPPPHLDQAIGMWSVNAPGFRTDDRRRHTAAATVTHYADQFLGGTHEFKFGVEYERSHAVVHKGYPGGILYLDYGGEPYMAYLQEPYWMRSSAARTTAYGQDRWRVGPVTLSPGVRVDVNRGSVPGKPGVFATTPVSPRFGVAWDLFADHSTVVRAHYGRYHDAMFANRFWYLDPGSVSPAYVARVVGPNQFQILSEWDFASTDRIDPHLRQSFVDQYVAGVERELVTDASLQVQYIARRFGNFMGWQNADALWSPLVAHDPGPDGKAGTADDGGDLAYYVRNNPGVGVSVLSNPEGLYRRYDAIQVVLRKRYSRNWQLQASYTWSRSSGTVRNLDYVNAGYSDLSPGFPITPNTFANSPGRPPYDPQEFKAFGTYRWNPWGGINASAIFTWRSGSTWTRTVFVPGVGNLRAEPLGARRLPATRALDLRVDKTMRLPGRAGTLSAFLDIFNVTNQGIQTGASARSGPTLGQPAGWSDPRMFRVGVRVAF